MRFRLTPRSMTLDEFELFEFSENFTDLGGNNKCVIRTNEDSDRVVTH